MIRASGARVGTEGSEPLLQVPGTWRGDPRRSPSSGLAEAACCDLEGAPTQVCSSFLLPVFLEQPTSHKEQLEAEGRHAKMA